MASGNFVQFLFGHGHGFGTFSFPDGAISGDTVAFAFVYGLGWLGAGALVCDVHHRVGERIVIFVNHLTG